MAKSSNKLGTGKIKVSGKTYEVSVYGYEDPETGYKYRTVFIGDFTDRDPDNMPKTAKIMYQGRGYKAEKYGNPNNQRPTYDFILPSSK